MKHKINFILILIVLLSSCYREDDFNPYKLMDIMELKIENDSALADTKAKIKVITEFPSDFNTESDNKVDFTVFKDNVEQKTSEIRLVEREGVDKKIAEILISHNKGESLRVEARITINKSEVSKSVEISFVDALCESIEILSSSLKIVPDSSFNEISITTQLHRDDGVVSIGTIAETTVLDSEGQQVGIFNNYQNKTDSIGKIVNRYTLGNENYLGKLYVISNSIGEHNKMIADTLILYSQK